MARTGKHTTFSLGTLGMGAGLLLLGLVPQWVAAGLGYTVLTARYFVADAGFHVTTQESVAPGWRSTISGTAMMAEGGSRILVGLAGGLAISAYGYRLLFVVAAFLAVGAGLMFWLYFSKRIARAVILKE
jgi:MFS family permease